MKRFLIGLAAAVVLVTAVGVFAQDNIYSFRGAFLDVQVTQPCAPHGGLKGPVAPFYYDRNAWLVYTCNNDVVILRRYFNPNDNAERVSPVYVVPAPFDPAAICSKYPGFVLGKRGNCVPPDHPDAK